MHSDLPFVKSKWKISILASTYVNFFQNYLEETDYSDYLVGVAGDVGVVERRR